MAATCSVVVLVVVFVFISNRSDSPLDSMEASLSDACGEITRSGESLMLGFVEGEREASDCAEVLWATIAETGAGAEEIEGLFLHPGGAVTSDGVRTTVVVRTPLPGNAPGDFVIVELANCDRSAIPNRVADWKYGIPLDGFWSSPCDEDFSISFIGD